MSPSLRTISANRALIDGTWQAATIEITGDRITDIIPGTSAVADLNLEPDQLLLPGIVDTHVHFGEPGHGDQEGYASGTLAAACGGVTTLLEMPMPADPATTSSPALALKASLARDRILTNVGFYAGITPDNLGRLSILWERGVYGLVAVTSATDASGYPALSKSQLAAACEEVASFDGLLMLYPGQQIAKTATSYAQWRQIESGYDQLEVLADVLEIARRTGVRLHLLSITSAKVLPLIAQAKADGVRVTAETSTPYLVMDDSKISDADVTLGLHPPIGTHADQDALWAALSRGTLDVISSGHHPRLPLRSGWSEPAAGTWSVETSLPLAATIGKRRGIKLSRIIGWLSTAPARIIGSGVSGRGLIQVGSQADFAVYDVSRPSVIDSKKLHYKVESGLFDGFTTTGKVTHTVVGGVLVDVPGTASAEQPSANQRSGELIFKY